MSEEKKKQGIFKKMLTVGEARELLEKALLHMTEKPELFRDGFRQGAEWILDLIEIRSGDKN